MRSALVVVFVLLLQLGFRWSPGVCATTTDSSHVPQTPLIVSIISLLISFTVAAFSLADRRPA